MLMIINMILFFVITHGNFVKSEKVQKFFRDQFLTQAVINFTRCLIYFDLCSSIRYTTFDTIVLVIGFITFTCQQFVVMGLYFNPDLTKKWKSEQKMFAMTENIFGMALFLVFRAFKLYPNLFWTFVLLHSFVKIAYSMKNIFKGKTKMNQFINGLVVAAECFRYVFYIIIILWT